MEVSNKNNGPVKTREFHNFIMDSTLWNDFKYRDDDIVIATWAKAGTTWMQQIVSQLIFNGAEGVKVGSLSPWLDFRLTSPDDLAGVEAQTHRRFIKTHLPADALLMSPKAKYIYIARDGRDVAWSFFNHQVNFSAERLNEINAAPGLIGQKMERGADNVLDFYRDWLARDGYPAWPFWDHIRSWWQLRALPNVKLVHFNELKIDLGGSVGAIADFLNIAPDNTSRAKIIEHCTFAYMKENAELMTPNDGASFIGGAKTFINKGTNGRWRDVLSADEVAEYDAKALAELGPECAAWLAQ